LLSESHVAVHVTARYHALVGRAGNGKVKSDWRLSDRSSATQSLFRARSVAASRSSLSSPVRNDTGFQADFYKTILYFEAALSLWPEDGTTAACNLACVNTRSMSGM
jgi:hypothetical protein